LKQKTRRRIKGHQRVVNKAVQMYSQSISYANPPRNIMEEAQQLFRGVVSWHQRSLEEVAANTDPDAWLPKLYFGLWVFVAICVVVCTSFGVGYHYVIFKSVSGSSWLAFIGSALFLTLIELGTVFFGLALFHAIFLKTWWRSWSRVWLVLGVGVIVFFATLWSIRISTKGVSELNRSLKNREVFQSVSTALPSEVTSIDAQIAALEKANAFNQKSTWRGRPTKESLDNLKANADLQAKLLQQRQLLLESAKGRQDSLTNNQLAEAASTSTLLVDYGGKAEYGKLIGLFLIAVVAHIIRGKVQEERIAQGLDPLPKKG
jgi:hypothetical protein